MRESTNKFKKIYFANRSENGTSFASEEYSENEYAGNGETHHHRGADENGYGGDNGLEVDENVGDDAGSYAAAGSAEIAARLDNRMRDREHSYSLQSPPPCSEFSSPDQITPIVSPPNSPPKLTPQRPLSPLSPGMKQINIIYDKK